jgi:PAS domain S-box-containing protein
MPFSDLNDLAALTLTLSTVGALWWGWGRKWWRKRRAPIIERNANRDAMYARFGDYADKVDNIDSSVGRMTGEMRTVNSTLADQNKVLGVLRARSQSVYESSPNAEFECDSDGRNESVNAKYAELLGVEKADLLDYRWRSFVPSAELQPYLARFQAAANDHRKFDDEIVMCRGNGTLIRVRVHMIPYPPDVGPATHWTGILTLVGDA